ncbi:MAG: hypothetical protein IKD73_03425 [Selenomonadaceae bacterium]|nr:hypothetical protein [Selenomonadaceae bacterium]
MREIFFGREKISTLNAIFFHVALIAMSFAFVYVFSYSTSFGYDLLGGDSAVFQVVGKYWLEGVLPYKEIFDHKGPIVYVINAIGYAIYPRSGIMVPQIICLYVSLLFLWRITEILKFGRAKILVFALTILYYVAHYHAGNYATEYNMPFLMAAVYIFLRDLNAPRVQVLHGFIYGFGFGASVLLRTTNAMPLCCCAFLSAIFLLKSGDLKNLWQNFLSFCSGFLVIVLPFVIYFVAHGALYDMLYGTILFNMKYIGVPAPEYSFLYKFLFVSVHAMPMIFMTVASLGEILQGRTNKLIVSGLFIGVIMIILQAKMRPYPHYYMTTVPLIPMFVAICSEFVTNSRPLFNKIKLNLKRLWRIKTFSFKRLACKFFFVTVSFYFAICAHFYFSHPDFIWAFSPSAVRAADEIAERELKEVTELKKIIPENERDSFVCWGDHNTTTHWIIYADMKPRERLFMNNAFLIKVDRDLWIEWFNNVTSNPPLWILYGTRPDRKIGELPRLPHELPEIEQFLADKYSLRGQVKLSDQMMKLYRLKE